MKLRTKIIIFVLAILLVVAVIAVPVFVAGRGDNIELAVLKGDTARVRILLRFSPLDAKSKGFHDYTPLHWAAMNGRTEIARMLIAKGADVNALSKENVSPLYLASMNGHTDIVKMLLKRGADVNVKCEYYGADYESKTYCSNTYCGFTPLYIATLYGHTDVMDVLIKHGADVNLAGDEGTPLLRAVQESNVKAVRLLLGSGAKPDAKSHWGYSPIGCVRNVAIARLLLSHGCRVDCRDGDRNTPLHNAMWTADPHLVRLLLEHGADPNAVNKYGNTPLHRCSNREAAELLLNHGARADVKNKDGMTPAQLAIEDGRGDVTGLLAKHTSRAGDIFSAVDKDDVARVRALLRSNPSLVNAAPGGSQHPILTIAIQQQNVDIVRVLLDAKADPLKRYGCCRPVDMAARSDNLEILRMMRSRVRGLISDREFLELAAYYGNMHLAKMLTAEGVSIEQNGDKGAGLLGEAAGGGEKKMLEYLLSQGADANGRDSQGKTPLMHVCDADVDTSESVAKVLLDNGADVTPKDSEGNTVLQQMYCRSPQSYETLKLLIEHSTSPDAVVCLSKVLKETQDPRVIALLIRYGAKDADDQGKPGLFIRIRESIRNMLNQMIP